jgi:alpha-tubulin suppressor-like RCC1 family protein
VPTRLLGDPGFASITVGDTHACGFTVEGIAYCWGDDFRGQTGGGPSAPLESPRRSATPVAGDLRFLALRAGPESTCGLVLNGDLYCWGGSSTSGEAIIPRPVQEGFGFTGLDYGGTDGSRNQVCATDGLGNVYCFEYQTGELLPQPTPAAVVLPGGGAARQAAVGGVWTPLVDLPYGYEIHVCAVDAVGELSCWGSNSYGQLGDGTTSGRPTPIQVPQLTGITGVTSGGVHSCAVTENGSAYCWGANHRNQLGMGRSSDNEAIPQQVVPPRP